MKTVSYKIAKSLKDAGYPQEGPLYYTSDKELFNWNEIEEWDNKYYSKISAPCVMDVWLWLWQEKRCYIQTLLFENDVFRAYIFYRSQPYKFVFSSNDPEEAIEKTIEYLVENNLIK